ncbi:signal peptidase II [Vagococcus xieshaowenii]|uniref:Lipoprotein signal peptidase n=1 Tax=Vagococcus xieshaowenii TaxID=2562451 RepID=A0AAJ5JM63_9ENTE|nr:signal peptidase II [Vagococcus xieshaowenii]QCA28586.1 signal peptidase II [Vagococcus xieshaowenii]TFZ40606.1 signal peptidase II [Vagococcus xieshaowenii]
MIYLLLVIALVAIDQAVKFWTVQNIALGETIFHNPIISLTYLQNDGAAWSMLEGQMWFFYIITIIAIGVLGVMIYKNRQDSKWLTLGLTAVLAGAIGNFIDRLHLKYVIDMFQVEFFNFPIFNIADVCISIGVVCIFIYLFFVAEED